MTVEEKEKVKELFAELEQLSPAKAAPMRDDVTQADREVFKDLLGYITETAEDKVDAGLHDDDRRMLVIARHRLAHTTRPDAGNEDVERVARAIAGNHHKWDGLTEDGKGSYRADARAALAAMREGVDRGMVERAARIVEAGYRCRTCMAVFVEDNDHIDGGHPDNGCTYPNWDKLEEAAQVEAIRDLSLEQPR